MSNITILIDNPQKEEMEKIRKQILEDEKAGDYDSVDKGLAAFLALKFTEPKTVVITDEEIEKEANKLYPSHYTDWEDGIRKKAFMNAWYYIKSRINQ